MASGPTLVPLRRRLFLLVAAAIVPLALIAGIGLVTLVDRQHEEARRAGIELTRALATAVDAELRRSVSVLEAVVSASALEVDDLAAFHRRIVRILESQPHWHAIAVVGPDGAPLLHTGFSYGARLPPLADAASLALVRDRTAPVIGNLAPAGPGERGDSPLAFSIRVPVMRRGALTHVAIAIVDPDAIVEILRRQRVPEDWVISIFDAAGQRVARSRHHEEYLGSPGSPSVVALMASPADEGWGRTVALEGDDIYTAYSRVKGVDWTVATGIPKSTVEIAITRTAITFGGGLVLSIAIGIAASGLVARSITNPIAALRRAAEAVGRREPLTPPSTPILEIQRVGEALTSASEERARAEREREVLLEREQEARAAAEAASRAKDEFLAMLGHELRNPLGAISNAVAMLHRGKTPTADAQAALEIVARQTGNLARLTDDLLDVGRVITGKVVLACQPLDLARVVARALETVDVGGRRLVRELHPVWVDGDPTRIEQIVVNLLANAVKYTADTGTITVAVGADRGAAVLRLADDGVGMPRELVARVFDLFVQGERSLDRGAGGLGIGLTLVQRIAELHGGSVEAASAGPGKGSEFTVRLPAIPAAPQPTPDPPTAEPLPATGRAREVLVIEDNDDARISLCRLLELLGHRVRTASDGPTGLSISIEAGPELVLIDVGLPGMDGYEVARRLRAARGTRVTLVALTGYGMPEDRERALAAGFDEHLVKPVDLAVLMRLLA